MKICSSCFEGKEIEEFSRNRKTRDGYSGKCKKCTSKYFSTYKKRDDGKWVVYYLPEENYYGLTLKLKDRILSHKKDQKNTEGYQTISLSDTKEEALFLKNQLQGKTRICSTCKKEQILSNFWKGYKQEIRVYNMYSENCKECTQKKKKRGS